MPTPIHAHFRECLGGSLSRIFSYLWGQREYRILILGLDGAGKTTILYRLQATGGGGADVPEITTTIPTIGFNMESVTLKNIKVQVWDLGGQSSIRPYWRCYFANTDGIVYVIDSADRERVSVTRAELTAMLQEEELRTAALLILANKQDLPEALSAAEISEALHLTDLKDRSWSIQKTSALKGTGLDGAFDW